MEDRKLAELLVIFETDFEDLTRGQLQFLRIRYREETGIKDTLTKEQLFEAYLNLKRKYFNDYEMLLFCPRTRMVDYGAFGGCKLEVSKITVPTYASLTGHSVGQFTVTGHTSLPVLNVSITLDKTVVYCIAPDGEFCKISSTDFDFEI